MSLIICCLITACESPTNETAKTPSSPNIIYILADDLGYGDLSCYGQTQFSTPNIDRIAKNGVLFTQHYSGNTVCAPSRSALLTGKHTGHTPIRGNKEVQPEGQHPLPDSIVTVGETLKEVGYVTGTFGKWGLGFPGSEGDPVNQGFDQFYGYNCQRLAHHYYPYYLWDNVKKVVLEENAGNAQKVYGPELIHAKALDFIEQNKDTSFFLFYASLIPHAELFAPEEYMEKYRGKFLPEKIYEGVDEGDRYRLGPYGSQPESHAAFVAMVELLDQQVGEILDKIEALGLSENTLIVFTSDNGPHQEGGADPDYFDSNGPLQGYKRDLYEGGIRVPFLAQWPGKIAPGTTSDHISAFWDFYPTACAIAGATDTRNNLDGISYLPSLLGQNDQEEHEYLYWEFHERGGRIAIRKGDWKAVKYDVVRNPNRPIELYNLSKDIGETNDLAKQHPEVIEEMKRLFAEARTNSEVFSFNPK
ncbi:MAG: arylsulfatase [Bacteroidota bacterium]